MKLYVVHRTVGGYAREDADRSDVVGVYTDKEVARKVAVISGGCWEEMILDYVWSGIKARAEEFGMTL